MSRAALKRRELLRSLGAASFLAGAAFRDGLAQAQPLASPSRFVVLYLPGGVFYPPGSGGHGNFTFSKVLAPLAGLQTESIVFEGLENLAAHRMWAKSNEPHGAAMRGLLTGDSSVYQDGRAVWAKTDTIDQTIADVISKNVRFSSLQFGVHSDRGAQIDQRRLIVKGGQAQPAVDSPSTMFMRLFGDKAPAPTAGSSSPPQQAPATPAADATHARDKSILDHLRSEVTALKALAGSHEQSKLDQHLTALRELEKRVQVPPASGGGADGSMPPPATPGAGCKVPSVPSGEDIPATLKNQLDLMYQALACDLTRVASLQVLCSAQSGIQFPWLNVKEDHHTLEHCGGPCGSNLDKVQTYFVEQFATFLNRLKATREGDRTMLDNSLVLLVSELSDPEQHSHENILAVTFGRAGGAVKPGRRIAYVETPHNVWLRSLLQVFGINRASIGDADANGGTPISLG